MVQGPVARYLEASKSWAPTAIGKDWVGIRYLGGGSYGMATLFEYQGDNPDVSPRYIVVKQEGGHGQNLKQESRILQRLMEYESDHIIKIYKAYHRTMGQGTSIGSDRSYDPPIVQQSRIDDEDNEDDREMDIYLQLLTREQNDVARIYLECATNGDLYNWMSENCDDIWPSEEYLWRLWECLLKALMILRYGTEDWRDDLIGDDRKLRHVPVAHFDIKGQNILIGGHPKPGHERIWAHKLADFGLALEVPPTEELNKNKAELNEWIKITKGRNTYHAPEQLYATHPNRVIGHQTDLWNMAHVIYMAMNNVEPMERNVVFETGVDPNPSDRFLTMGLRLLDPDREIYSRKLRGVLLRCLAFDPHKRWNVEDVLEEAQEVLEHWNFGDEHDLFLGAIQGDYDGWSGTYPENARDDALDSGMDVTKQVKRRKNQAPRFFNPLGWQGAEDEEDFAGVQLLFPSRKDANEGYRDMPFELGVSEFPHPLFPSWRRVGKDGKPMRDPDEEEEEEEEEGEEEEEEEEDAEEKKKRKGKEKEKIVAIAEDDTYTPNPKKRVLKQLAGAKRMRSAEESDDSNRFRWSRTPLSKQVAKKPRREPSGVTIPEKLEYAVSDSGTLLQRRVQPTPKPGRVPERSAPWVPHVQQDIAPEDLNPHLGDPKQYMDDWDSDDCEDWKLKLQYCV